jgi:hypothetical protein
MYCLSLTINNDWFIISKFQNLKQSMTSNKTKEILDGYKKSEKDKEEKIKKLIEEYSDQSETEDEESMHYSKFAEEGSEAIKIMTGFTISEFMEIYSVVEKDLKVRGRGKKPEIGPLDSFFFTLVMLKHYESWDKFAVTYKVKRPGIILAITKTLEKIVELLTKELMKIIYKDEQLKKNIQLEDYPEVGLVVDVTFQQRSRPKMLFNEAQYYFSGKHGAYGFKTEVAHLPNGLAIFISDTYAGSVHDFTIFKDNVEGYKTFLEKKSSDHKVEDKGELKNKYPKHWALMADKGYQGAVELLRAILPCKGKEITKEDTLRNKKIAKNRIICENFYGRMKKLFKIMEGKFKWDEKMYSIVFKVCSALTNYHIMKYPLRNEDGIYYNVVLKTYADIELEKKRKQQEKNKIYREKRAKIAE